MNGRFVVKKERVRVEKERSLIKKQYETDLGYYGLWNPKNNEFCIRDIRNQTGKKDKRSIHSGKRCINWTKPALNRTCCNCNQYSNTKSICVANIRRSKGGNKK